MAQKQNKKAVAGKRTKPREKSPVQREKSQRAYLRQLRMEQQERQENEANWRNRGIPMWGKTLIAVAVVFVLMLVLFRVREFEVSGNVRYTAEEVAEASGITAGDVLMGVSKTRAASRILTKLPYVEQVVISKSLPGTISFTVEECQAVMAAESEFGTIWLMNDEGKLLEKLDEDAETAYPLIKGTTLQLPTAGDLAEFDDAARGTLAMDTMREVQAAGLVNMIRSVDVTDLQQVTLNYEDRIEVQLGDASDLAYRLQYMIAAIAKLDANARGALDLSFAAGTQAVFHPLG